MSKVGLATVVALLFSGYTYANSTEVLKRILRIDGPSISGQLGQLNNLTPPQKSVSDTFNINSSTPQIAEVRVDIPETFNVGDQFVLEFMLPIPEGYYEELATHPVDWLGIKTPGLGNEGELPLQLDPTLRGPTGLVRTLKASAIMTLTNSTLPGTKVNIRVHRGTFASFDSKASTLLTVNVPVLTAALYSLDLQGVFIVGRDAKKHIYFSNMLNGKNYDLLHYGHSHFEETHYSVMEPLQPVSGSSPTLHRFLGVMSHKKTYANGVINWDVIFDNSSANLDDSTDLDNPIGELFFRELKLLIPDYAMVRMRFDRRLADFKNCQTPAVLKKSPSQGIPEDLVMNGYSFCDIIGKRSDSKLHVLRSGGTYTYSFSMTDVVTDSQGTKADAYAHLYGHAFVQPGQANGEEFFSWWNSETPWLVPVGLPSPTFDYVDDVNSNQSPEESLIYGFEHNPSYKNFKGYKKIYEDLQADYVNGTNISGEFPQAPAEDPTRTAYYQYGGLTGGKKVDPGISDAHRVAYAASREGLLSMHLFFIANQNRQRWANYRHTGQPAGANEYLKGGHIQGNYQFPGPNTNWVTNCSHPEVQSAGLVDWCHAMKDYGVLGQGGGVMVVDETTTGQIGYNKGWDKFGFADHMDQTNHKWALMQYGPGVAPYVKEKFKFDSHDAQHGMRMIHRAIALAYLSGDYAASRDLWMAAEHAMHDYSKYKEDGNSGNGSKFSGQKGKADSYPDSGIGHGRAEAWHSYAIAAAFGFVKTFYRNRMIDYMDDLINLLSKAQAPTGVIFSTINESKMIKGGGIEGVMEFPGQPSDEKYAATQHFEEEYGTWARRAIFNSMYKGTGSDSETKILNVMKKNARDFFASEHVWNEPNAYNGNWGYYYYSAVHPVSQSLTGSSIAPSGPVFTVNPMPGGNNPNVPNSGNWYPHQIDAMPMDIYTIYDTGQPNFSGPPFYGTSVQRLATYYTASPLVFSALSVASSTDKLELECRMQRAISQDQGFDEMLAKLQNFNGELEFHQFEHYVVALRYVQDRMAEGVSDFCL